MSLLDSISLGSIAAGETGAQAGVAVPGYESVAFQASVDAGTTITFKFQGSLDGTNWFDVGYITDASDTIATTAITKTADGVFVYWLSNPVARKFRFFRLNVSANTGTALEAEMFVV